MITLAFSFEEDRDNNRRRTHSDGERWKDNVEQDEKREKRNPYREQPDIDRQIGFRFLPISRGLRDLKRVERDLDCGRRAARNAALSEECRNDDERGEHEQIRRQNLPHEIARLQSPGRGLDDVRRVAPAGGETAE